MSVPEQTTPTRQPPWRRRDLWIALAALGILGAIVVAVPTVMAFRGIAGHGGHGLRHGMLQDPEQAKAHAALAVEWAFRAVEATDRQKKDGQVVVERLVDQLIPLRDRHLAHREAVARELVQAPVDRAALEQLRIEGLALADEASEIVLDGVIDLAEVLTPEQRAELLELAHRFHGAGRPPVD